MKSLQFLTKEECDLIINISEQLDDWGVKTSNNYSFKRCFFTLPNNIEKKLKNFISNNIKLNLKDKNLSFAVLKYEKNDFFGRHKDRYDGDEFNVDFIYNLNIKLNNKFTGGEFYHLDTLFNANIGDLYYYNSTDFHEVKKIKSGIRYTGLCYIRERDLNLNYKSMI